MAKHAEDPEIPREPMPVNHGNRIRGYVFLAFLEAALVVGGFETLFSRAPWGSRLLGGCAVVGGLGLGALVIFLLRYEHRRNQRRADRITDLLARRRRDPES